MLESFIYYMIFYAIVLGLGALSGIFSERVGIINIGIEGMMGMGALGYAMGATIIFKSNPEITSGWLQIPLLLFGMLFAATFSILHGLATIKLKSDHTISGVAINILALAIATIIMDPKVLGDNNRVLQSNINELAWATVEGYKKIISLKLFLFIGVFIAAFILLNKTRWGLRLKSIGENPQAAAVAGINVNSFKWQGVLISGAIAGLAGGIFSQQFRGTFTGSVNGLGFLALAIMIMSHWNVFYVVISTLFFSFFFYIGVMSQAGTTLTDLSLRWFKKDLGDYGVLFRTIPYILTLFSLVVFSKSAPGPAAVGFHYDKSKR